MKVGKRMAVTIAALAISLSASGCYKATFTDPSVTPGIEHDRWTDFFVFGLVGTEVVDVHEFCSNGRAAQVRTGGNFPTLLVSVVTIFIYTPRKVYVTCASEAAAAAPASTTITLGLDGRPDRVVRREAGRVRAGTPVALGDGRWRVAFEEEGVR